MKALNQLKISEAYISGFKDLYRHESPQKVLIGVLKVISYSLILPPLILGYIYLKNKKIVDLQTQIDSKIDTNKIQDLFSQTINQDPHDQSKMVNYLVNKLVNFETNDNEQMERQRFENGFKRLSLESQEALFKNANQSNCLEMALKWIPRDIKELRFRSGPENAIFNSETNQKNIQFFLKELRHFTHLDKLELNLKGLGFYTEILDKNLQDMTQAGNNTLIYTEDPRQVWRIRNRSYIYYTNDHLPILQTLKELKNFIQSHPELKWEMSFMNFGIRREGPDNLQIVGEMKFAKNLITYLCS